MLSFIFLNNKGKALKTFLKHGNIILQNNITIFTTKKLEKIICKLKRSCIMKKKSKIVISVLTAIVVVGTVNYFLKNENSNIKNLISVSASSNYEDLKYEIIDEQVTVFGVIGESKIIEIPIEIEGYPVTCIYDRAFLDCHMLERVTLPNSILEIGEFAFSGCESLVSVNIPNKIKTIDNNVFNGCISLASIEIPN